MIPDRTPRDRSVPFCDFDSPFYRDLGSDLAEAWRRGELTKEACCAVLYGRLRQHVRDWTNNRNSEDVLHETVLLLCEGGAAKYDRQVAALKYMRGFVRNIERGGHRKRRREVNNGDRADRRVDDGEDPLARVSAQQFVQLVRSLLRHLTPRQRWAIAEAHPWLREPNHDARRLSNNVDVDRHRGLETLRRLLAERGWADEARAREQRRSRRLSRKRDHRPD